ncbi:MAG: glycosyltransferase family 2 protein [Rhodospirillales bacterium]|nr:glycosyltransferase family 2 protein [Rhodospirillales bacterium]MDE2199221.1 glycosyltransferase family 2 protein [Rhodospirillales bacterium]MDE2573693.1 glycosyltransferase family 2 protein [Rhodospirillales bacterium]
MSLAIDFSVGGNSQFFIGAGWSSVPESGFTWTNGTYSILRLPLSAWRFGHHCSIVIMPYTREGVISSQQVIVSAMGFELLRKSVDTWTKLEFDIPPELTNGIDLLDLQIDCPGATAPITLGNSTDTRNLGVAVSNLLLEESEIQTQTTLGGIHTVIEGDKAIENPKVAVVCMTYNEPEYLPIWLNHYKKQVGINNCFVIDHGSTDGTTSNLHGCSVLHLPRTPYHPGTQSHFNSEFCSSLLSFYDYVLYTDVDEFVVPDPNIAKNLIDYCRRPLPPVLTMIGLNVVHLPDEEPDLDIAMPILKQRRFVRFSSSMCKATLIRQPVTWAPGSHSANSRTIFDHLYLFHLKWFDRSYGLKRLQRTREMPWALSYFSSPSRAQDDEMIQTFDSLARLPRATGIDFDPREPPVSDLLDQVLSSRVGLERHALKISLDIWGEKLWEVPQRFAELL